jgi:hypothetical protein
MPVTFPDGTRALLTYPSELDLASMGIQPDVSYLYRADRPPRFPLAFYRGDPPAAALAGAGPIDRFATRVEPKPNSGTPLETRTGRKRAAKRWPTGSCSGSAPGRSPRRFATRVRRRCSPAASTARNGRRFHRARSVSADRALERIGRGEGPKLTIGDSEPDPDRLRVDDRFRHIELWVERCSDTTEELSPSGEYDLSVLVAP